MEHERHGEDEWVVERHSSFDFLSRDYRDLFARAGATAFQTPLWLDRLYARLVPAIGAEPAVIAVRARADGRLAAVLPLLVRRRYGMRVAEFADLGVCDYCAPVVETGLLADTATLDGRIARLLDDCDLLVVRKIPEHVRADFALVDRLRWSQMGIHAHRTVVSGPYAAWRAATLSDSRIRFLDIKRRKLHRQGRIELKCPDDPAGIAQALEAIRSFRAYRFNETGLKDLLAIDAYAQFYREAGAEAPPARAYVMTADGRPVSVAFGLVHDGAFNLLLSGFDFARLRNFSLGLLMIEDIAADLIARGEPVLDLTIGDQPYKQEFGTQPTAMWMAMRGISARGRLLAGLLARLPWAQLWARALARRLTRRRETTEAPPS